MTANSFYDMHFEHIFLTRTFNRTFLEGVEHRNALENHGYLTACALNDTLHMLALHAFQCDDVGYPAIIHANTSLHILLCTDRQMTFHTNTMPIP